MKKRRNQIIPAALLELAESNGFIRCEDIDLHVPNSFYSILHRALIIENLAELGITVFPAGKFLGTIGKMADLDDERLERLRRQYGRDEFESVLECHFSFVCDKKLSDLDDYTDDISMRYCDKCDSSVKICITRQEASEAIASRQCVALLFKHRPRC